MKKKISIAIGTIVLSIMFIVISIQNSKAESSNLENENLELLTSDENPMDLKVWDVYAESSTHWHCNPNGKSACPAP